MKKLHFSLMAILFALFAMVSFTACSSSDDDDTPSTESIKEMLVGGKWLPTHVSGWARIEAGGDVIQVDRDLSIDKGFDDYEVWTFNSDMTCYSSWTNGGSWNNNPCEVYGISGNTITIYGSGYNEGYNYVYNVISINSKKMVVECEEDAEEFPGKKYRLTYEKAV